MAFVFRNFRSCAGEFWNGEEEEEARRSTC
jgi:hypothetical protein